VLMSKSDFKDSVHVTRSYFGVLRECLGKSAPIPGMRPSRVEVEA